MCGIAGVVQAGGVTLSADALARMGRAVEHRGPDDRGAWRSADGEAAYVHARLAILDLSPAGHQPMTVAGGRYTITYNGEIYNYTELRHSLVAAGIEFHSQSDTEVIVRLYEAHGPECVSRLRGMFAFAIWDHRERTCFLARDAFGIKPLYYCERNGALLFASEVRSLLASGWIEQRLDPQATYEYFRSGSVPEPLTLCRGIRALEAGHSMTWRAGRTSQRRYWDVRFSSRPYCADPVAVTRQALLESVAAHFVSDVPVGVFLSGGLDSTALVALSSITQHGQPIRTMSLSFPGSPLDEGPDARRTAKLFKTEHHEWPITAPVARALVEECLFAADQPSIDGLNTFTVSRLARRFGAKVVLSGVGGDELFGGYPSFRSVPRLARVAAYARLGRPVTGSLIRLAAGVAGSKMSRLADLLASRPTLDNAYSTFRGVYTRAEAVMLTDHFVGGADGVLDTIDPLSSWTNADAKDEVSRMELTRYMRNQLLRDTDVMSMASGIELRVPFLDAKLFSSLANIPSQIRTMPRKRLLTLAVPEIPDWIVNRPKRGFVFPMRQWLDRDWAGEFQPQYSSPRLCIDTWYRKWAIVALERWLGRTVREHVAG